MILCPRDILCHGLSLPLPCCPPAALSRLICSQRLRSCRSFWDGAQLKLSVRHHITRQKIWKAQRWCQKKPESNTAGDFMYCPQLPVHCQATNTESGDEGNSRASGIPFLTSEWMADKTTGTIPLDFDKKATGGRQKKNSLNSTAFQLTAESIAKRKRRVGSSPLWSFRKTFLTQHWQMCFCP